MKIAANWVASSVSPWRRESIRSGVQFMAVSAGPALQDSVSEADVFVTIAKRQEIEMRNVEAIVEIAAEPAGFARL